MQAPVGHFVTIAEMRITACCGDLRARLGREPRKSLALAVTALIIRLSRAEIAVIADNKAAPTFENTIAALDDCGRELTRAGLVFNIYTSTMNDLAGFATGWVLFLDYLIVIALSALFLPHYVGAALEADVLRDRPWDIVVAVAAIPAPAGR